jgi:hypothetical protein
MPPDKINTEADLNPVLYTQPPIKRAFFKPAGDLVEGPKL